MSGDVVLADTSDRAIGRLLQAASSLFARSSPRRAALVGGLAVTMRLGTVHRATVDVDVVTEDGSPHLAQLDVVGELDEPGAGRFDFDGVKVDLMPTSPLPTTFAELPDDDLQRLFVLGHRWALESAEALTVRVESARGPVDVVTLPVAVAPALVACKYHAISDRRDARSAKRESDALDLVRLVDQLVRMRAAAVPFRDAPFDLVGLVAEQTRRWLVDGATRTAGLVSFSGGTGDVAMEAADIAAIGGLSSMF